MKRLEFVSLKTCPHCRRAIAYLMTQDGEKTFGIALDPTRARELSCKYQEPGEEKFMTGFLVRLLASSSYFPRQVILDWSQEDFLSGRVDLATEIITCSPQEGLALAVLAGIPLYGEERIFEHMPLFHPPDPESEGADLIQPKLKPTLH